MAPSKPRPRTRPSRTRTHSDTTDVVIVEEYIPEYRRRFFELLEAALDAESIRLTIAVATAPPAVAARGDGVAKMTSVQRVPAVSVSIAQRRLTFKRLSGLVADPKLVVVDQALRHLESYPLLVRQRAGGPKLALWGHGSRHAKRSNRLEQLVERGVMRSAHWFFAYTQRGADHVAAGGFPRERITVVQNTIDARALSGLRQDVSVEEQRQLQTELDLPERNVCLYLGALDRQKRIAFLLEACSLVARRIPGFVLVVAGDGGERQFVEDALATAPWLRYVGRADGPRKARLGAASDVLLMPGSVGLVAVDSFALQTPIVTTVWPYHGPEVEYLEDGVNARFSGDTVLEYAEAVEHVLRGRNELARLKAACAAAAGRYSLESMVERFSGGVISALGASRR